MEENNAPLALESEVIQMLKQIFDPEIPVNIYDLGLIYDIIIDAERRVEVVMTLTAPNCPIADQILEEVQFRIAEIPAVAEVKVTLTFDPPWGKEMMSEEALLELGML